MDLKFRVAAKIKKFRIAASPVNTEAYSELCQASKMEHFTKAVNYFRKTLHL